MSKFPSPSTSPTPERISPTNSSQEPQKQTEGKGCLFTFVGDFYQAADELAQKPFFGSAGQELTRLTREVRIDLKTCSLTNVFNLRPPNNDLRSFCVSKAAATHSYPRELPRLRELYPEYPWAQVYDLPPLMGIGSFLHPSYLTHIAELRRHIQENNPKLVVGMGGIATWALLRSSGIGKLRGYTFPCTFLPGGPRVLPTYHPTSCLQQYSHRPVVIADLKKALRLVSGGGVVSSGGLEVDANRRTLWIEPSYEDLETWRALYIPDENIPISVDIETFGGTITCIGFGVKASAICVPFWLRSHEASGGDLDGRSYWSAEDELRALRWVRDLLHTPNPKILQNAQYDLQYLWKTWGMGLNGPIHDTMLMAHALQPEMEKSLGFLGSTYTDSPAWKHLRKVSETRAKLEKKDA
jgi:uracil-DNA glycosylase